MTDLMALLTQLSGAAEPVLLAYLHVFMRVAAAVALLPAFGEHTVPQRVKLAIALAFTAITGPAVLDRVPVAAGLAMAPLVIEAVIGCFLGLGLRFFVFALQIAGTIIAQSTSLAQLLGGAGAGAGAEPQPVIGNILTLAALALAVSAGLHVQAAELLILSYQMLPPGQMLHAPDVAQWGLHQVTRAFGLALSLAAPFVIGSLLYNVALGIINRAMPQLMVAFIGAPALTWGGLVLFAVAAPLILSVWLAAFAVFVADPLTVAP
ncbi:flagellar biosynthetic protein FliR [Gemmobacter fulvus]|uniref:Flagellar biosynthetic protein FliR n=1 Tax=Gemmobacter fulvus TaxID=2840474 RepID=A0A975P563_9RHOB|nr:flagellar biosynthetic protein FliR [Gemmobacter fulvus]QWK89218.1 flagellar biosynthetic protein FliR [Gemmobacter fulvus]